MLCIVTLKDPLLPAVAPADPVVMAEPPGAPGLGGSGGRLGLLECELSGSNGRVRKRLRSCL